MTKSIPSSMDENAKVISDFLEFADTPPPFISLYSWFVLHEMNHHGCGQEIQAFHDASIFSDNDYDSDGDNSSLAGFSEEDAEKQQVWLNSMLDCKHYQLRGNIYVAIKH